MMSALVVPTPEVDFRVKDEVVAVPPISNGSVIEVVTPNVPPMVALFVTAKPVPAAVALTAPLKVDAPEAERVVKAPVLAVTDPIVPGWSQSTEPVVMLVSP